jgi:hypothetical protein
VELKRGAFPLTDAFELITEDEGFAGAAEVSLKRSNKGSEGGLDGHHMDGRHIPHLRGIPEVGTSNLDFPRITVFTFDVVLYLDDPTFDGG